MSPTIRLATQEDLPDLLKIYKPYVEETAISFEYNCPSLEDFTQRWQSISQIYPYFVAENKKQILGYAYASAFHPREAYQWLAEVTIYLAPNAKGMGLGRLFYEQLESCLKAQGILTALACIATTAKADSRLTNNSQEFHQHLGYQVVGHFKQAGYKFGRWYDMKWLEKSLATTPSQPQPIIPFSETSLYQEYKS
ncbi:N-acetyltransferase family protein [Streptococcus dentasini]